MSAKQGKTIKPTVVESALSDVGIEKLFFEPYTLHNKNKFW